MDSQRGKLVVLRIGLTVAMVALILGGVWKYRSRPSSLEGDPPTQFAGLYVNPQQLDFGEVWEDDHFSWTLPIENRSQADVSIERFYNSCICTEISPKSLVIPAGQSRDVRLTIDLMAEKVYDRQASAVRDFRVTVSAIVRGYDGKEVNQDWEIRGRVKRSVEFEPSLVDFGMHSDRAQPLPPKRIVVKCLAPLDSLAVSGSIHQFPVHVARRAEDPSCFDLEIIPETSLSAVRYKFDLSVVPIQAGGRRLAAQKLPVTAWIVPDVQAFPPQVAFGAISVGESVEGTIMLSSLTKRTFEVEDWRCASNQVLVVREPSPAGDPTFQVKWRRVNAAGEHRAEVFFRIKVNGEEVQTVKVPVSCLGIEEAAAKLP